jgi:hypothetical protein
MFATLGASQNAKAIDCYVPCDNIDAKESKLLLTLKELCTALREHL